MVVVAVQQRVLAYVSSHGVVTALSTTWTGPSGMGRIPASPGPQTNSKRAKEYEGFQKWKTCPTVCLFQASEGNVMVFVRSEGSPAFPNHLVQDAGRRQSLILRHIPVPTTPDPERHPCASHSRSQGTSLCQPPLIPRDIPVPTSPDPKAYRCASHP